MNRRAVLRLAGSLAAAGGLRSGRLGAQPARQPMRDVVVLVPGITGSVLRKDGRDLWALSGSAFFDALKSTGRNLDALRLVGDDESLDDLGDGITPHRLVDDLHIVPGLWRIDGYTAIARSLAQNYRLTPGENYFEFPYDWRRSNVVAARRLARESAEWLRRWRRSSGHPDAKLIFLAHSMGGLVVRWFAECLEGWRDTRMLVTFGTPYRGSLNAVGFVCNGMKKSIGSVELVDLTNLLRSMTSVYQLLPIYPCIDTGSGLARVAEARGMPHLDAARAAQALAFHRAIERAVEEHRRSARYVEAGYRIHPIVGTFQPTFQTALLREGGTAVELLRTIGGREFDGDGTVPRPSATPIELSGRNSELFVAQSHGALQNTDGVLVQLARLLQPEAVGWDAFRDAARLSLRVDDTQLAGEPIEIAVRESEAGSATGLELAVVDVASGRDVARRYLAARDDGVHAVSLAPLPAGVYRLQVAGSGVSVADSFVVA